MRHTRRHKVGWKIRRAFAIFGIFASGMTSGVTSLDGYTWY
jgi:hypothetical protein